MNESPEIYSDVIVRMSANPVCILSNLQLRRTHFVLRHTIRLNEELRLRASFLSDALYEVIPLLDRKSRREVLAARRDIHNLRAVRLASRVESILAEKTPTIILRRFKYWCTLASLRDRWMALGQNICEKEVAHVTSLVISLMTKDDILKGVALASPDFAKSIVRGSSKGESPGSRFLRSCVSYLVRATVKASPLSTLTKIGETGFDRGSYSPGNDPLVIVNRAIASSLVWAFARHEELAPVFRYHHCGGIGTGENERFMVLPEHGVRHGVFTRIDRGVHVGEYKRLVGLARKIRNLTYHDCLSALGEGAPYTLFNQLLDYKLISPVMPWKPSCLNPFHSLAAALDSRNTGIAKKISAVISHIAFEIDTLCKSSGEKRTEILGNIKENISGIYSKIGQFTPTWLSSAPVVYEDTFINHNLPHLGEHIRNDIIKLSKWFRLRTVRSHLYDYIVNEFVSVYGTGGKSTNVQDFLCRVTSSEEFFTHALTSWKADTDVASVPGHERTRLPVGLGGAPPGATIYFQIAAHTLSDIYRGRYSLVVNRVTSDQLALLMRSLRSKTLVGDKSLHRWVEETRAGATPTQLPVYTDWNSLQFLTLESHQVLRWSGEPLYVDSPKYWTLDQLAIVHNPENNTLDLLGPDDQPITIQYTGLVPKQLTSGPLLVLLMLADPWIVGGTEEFSNILSVSRVPVGVEKIPREQVGRIVIRRACWRMAPSEFPLKKSEETDFQYLLRVEKWRRENRMPREVYLSIERNIPSLDANQRKPMWLHLESLHSLYTASALITPDTKAVRIYEALPSSSETWLLGDDGLPRTSEFVVAVRWPQSEELGS